jgi:hemoglobin
MLCLAACASSPAAPKGSLYERLGGHKGIKLVVNKAVDRISADKRVNEFFKGFDIEIIREHFVQLLCVASGGPCSYEGRSMKDSHQGLHITNAAFDAVLEDIGFTMRDCRLGAREQDDVFKILNGLRTQIVEER